VGGLADALEFAIDVLETTQQKSDGTVFVFWIKWLFGFCLMSRTTSIFPVRIKRT
jgi:hypothetical protein